VLFFGATAKSQSESHTSIGGKSRTVCAVRNGRSVALVWNWSRGGRDSCELCAFARVICIGSRKTPVIAQSASLAHPARTYSFGARGACLPFPLSKRSTWTLRWWFTLSAICAYGWRTHTHPAQTLLEPTARERYIYLEIIWHTSRHALSKRKFVTDGKGVCMLSVCAEPLLRGKDCWFYIHRRMIFIKS
jgi:hypothetical protein